MRGDVYMQSQWLALKVTDLYYCTGCSQNEIAAMLNISKATVSRLLKRARENGYIRFSMPEEYREALSLGETLAARYGLVEAIVVPDAFHNGESGTSGIEELRKALVATEGARYVQRIITPSDVLGIAWGRTLNLLVNHLNPCRRVDIPFITLHGSIQEADPSLDAEYLVRRMTMAFGGHSLALTDKALYATEEGLEEVRKKESVHAIFEMMNRITIAVAGVGGFSPVITSPIGEIGYLKREELKELQRKDVSCDFLLRFLDRDGREIASGLSERTLSIRLDAYRKIPCKILVAAGSLKADGVRSVLRAGLAEVLIVDSALAEALLSGPDGSDGEKE